MAYRITEDCTGCGECVPPCPVEAIRPGVPRPRILRQLCIECLGFAPVSQCVEACGPAAVVPDEAGPARHFSPRMTAHPAGPPARLAR